MLSLLALKKYDNAAVAAAVLEAFNRVYTPRLLSWRAFGRSALYTICLSTLFLYEAGFLQIFLHYPTDDKFYAIEKCFLVLMGTVLQVCTNIVSDYGSLFPVKRLLASKTIRPSIALWVGPLIGMAVVALCNLIGNAIYTLIMLGSWGFRDGSAEYLSFLQYSLESTISTPLWRVLLAAGMVVHLWLPLFSLSVASLRLLNNLRRAVGWTQWFLKDGRKHPFEAIGYVAAVIVFISSIVVFKL
jgi:hypothetical protein